MLLEDHELALHFSMLDNLHANVALVKVSALFLT